ncbi:hypothetical protein [Streptosporangium jomthongense]|uniref:Uncharacterized protein n=1 Tax=Streptosporangium jomthongense TaxID=1193683 RepID=A0ABV8EVI9_9ACTN
MHDPNTHAPTARVAVRGALQAALGLEYHDERLDPATGRVLDELLENGYTVVRPARIESSRVEDLLIAVRPVWDSTEGGDDARLRAVVTELVPLIAYRLGHHAGTVTGHRQGRRSR